MNNVTSIDLEYNFNNLRNMILFNKAKLLELAKVRRTAHAYRNVAIDDRNWLNTMIEHELDTILDITIQEVQLRLILLHHTFCPQCPSLPTMWRTGGMRRLMLNQLVLLIVGIT